MSEPKTEPIIVDCGTFDAPEEKEITPAEPAEPEKRKSLKEILQDRKKPSSQ